MEAHAFPNPARGPYGSDGMLLRDWFAGQALAANLNFGPVVSAADQAMHCYNVADEMLKARQA